MKDIDHIENHGKFAKSYDAQVEEYHSYGHDVLFGMCFEYIKTDENLLDLGIGTGLSSINFARIGLDITGLDGSTEMLEECRKKDFAIELKQFNLQDVPFPYPDNSFSHIICCGVFHFFGNLMPIIKDSFRLLRIGGIFAFTIASPSAKDKASVIGSLPDFIESPTAWGIPIFKHSDEYICSISEELGLKILKEQKVLADSGDKDSEDLLFKTIVMRKD